LIPAREAIREKIAQFGCTPIAETSEEIAESLLNDSGFFPVR